MLSRKLLILLFSFISFLGYSQTIRLPYNDDSGWMLVDLKVNNKPMTFLFDTGWDGLSIRSSLLKEFYHGEPIAAVDANNVVQAVQTMYVDSLKVGNHTFRHLPFTDMESFPMINDPIFDCYKIDGILGNVIYEGKVLEIDPLKKEIILQDLSKDLINTLLSNDFIKLSSIQMDSNARIVVPIALGKQVVRPFLFDTGDNGYVTISADEDMLYYLNQLKYNTYYSIGSVSAFGLDESLNKTMITQEGELQLNKTTFKEEELSFFTNAQTYQMGVEFIKQFHLYYLPQNRMLYLKKVRTREIKSTLERLGYGIGYVEGKYRVAAIGKSEKTVQMGDVVLEINGIPMEKLCNYRKYLQQLKEKPSLLVERRGKRLKL